MYRKESVAGVDIASEVFALDSTTISLSLKLFGWALGKLELVTYVVDKGCQIRRNTPK